MVEKENKTYLNEKPILLGEWDYEKNGDLKPEHFTANSNKKVWWKCQKGHEWQATINSRHKGHGCPFCAGQKAIKGTNDLKTLNPILASEWNYEKNNGLTPMDVMSNSGKKVWWKCKNGHEWQATIASRNSGVGCPFCAGKKAIKGTNDLKTLNPFLASEWNYEKNNGLTPMDVMSNSGKKVWWKCKNGHEWQATIASRNSGVGCPFCAGKKAIKGTNDLKTLNPFLASEWNYEKNGTLKPEHFTVGSSTKVWWKCQKGHEWQAAINSRHKGHGCPFCANLYPIEGETDLKTVNPTLASEWNYEKNGDLKPEHFTANSNKKVWWKCKKGHEWRAAISGRTQGTGCPYCAGQRVLLGYNDLKTVNPSLASEWNYEKNGNLTPEQFTAGSGQKVWWKCKKGHEWQARINNRNRDIGCPFCAGRYPIKGENDLQTLNPALASEWNYEKNGDLKPEQFTASSGKKVWWKCQKGHEWQASITNRKKGRGCPICNSERHTSFPEFAMIYYLHKYGWEAIHSYTALGYELDVYIPFKKVAIEYDGYYWHVNKESKDLKKNIKCKNDKITLYRIRENLPVLNDSSSIDVIIQNNTKDLQKAIKYILQNITQIDMDIDLQRDTIAIENLREHIEKEHSILFINPTLASEWNYEKNGKLKPEHFFTNSSKKVWWKCKNGHEWQATPNNRTRGNGCPFCSGRYPIKGKTDLQTVNPALASEWNYEKNDGLTPADILPNYGKRVWWKCKNGHEWQATPNSRTRGSGCPFCAGRYPIKGENDLQTLNPALASEWNYEKNGTLKPEHFTVGSSQKVWWKCKLGHEWQAAINSRQKGHGCPFCAGQKAIKGTNDLNTLNPILASEWCYEKNNGLTPADVMPYSDKKVWWKCKNGHEWQAAVKSRTKGHNCPYCSGRYPIKGETDLQTVNPALASEWNYEKNDGLTPADVSPSSNKKVWWKCKNGHEWQSIIGNRTKGRGCPYCSGRKKPL